MKLSAARLRLLRAADTVLPEIDVLQSEFDGLRDGRSGRLHIAIECHACFEWLFPVLKISKALAGCGCGYSPWPCF